MGIGSPWVFVPDGIKIEDIDWWFKRLSPRRKAQIGRFFDMPGVTLVDKPTERTQGEVLREIRKRLLISGESDSWEDAIELIDGVL